jgi:hypothetical protein
MADYDWSKPCGCEFMSPHDRLCESNPQYKANVAHDEHVAKMRAQGFAWHSEGLYKCRRGCGTLVWDVPDHVKNVCPTWLVIAGTHAT